MNIPKELLHILEGISPQATQQSPKNTGAKASKSLLDVTGTIALFKAQPLSWGERTPECPVFLPGDPAGLSGIGCDTALDSLWHLSLPFQIWRSETTVVTPLVIQVKEANVLSFLELKEFRLLFNHQRICSDSQ